MDNLSHYPVRLPKGDVYCYSCAAALLDHLSELKENGKLQGRVVRARECIEGQVECCRGALGMEEEGWMLERSLGVRGVKGDA